MPLIDEKMVFLPTETEKPRPIIAYNPMQITPPPPTPLLKTWPWGLKCTHLSDLALHCYISLYTHHNKLVGLRIGMVLAVRIWSSVLRTDYRACIA